LFLFFIFPFLPFTFPTVPNIRSAKKALRQNIRHRTRNLARQKALTSAVKAFKKAVAASDFGTAQQLLSKVYQVADKVAKSGYIKKNAAARIKSRASSLLKRASAQH
jgi:small subunit ribosomal protein S20